LTEEIDDVLPILEDIARKNRNLQLTILDKTASILKARLFFTEDICVQIYINSRKPKKSYTLIVNDRRIFGKDFVWNKWHTHPFENPDIHDSTGEGEEPITVQEFIQQATFILSEKVELI
jgi:hypothetical protein